jgi:uncharacterized protein with HEPN domain
MPLDFDKSLLLDMDRACRLILQFKSGLDEAAFRLDEKTQSAVIHQLLILGEATKRLSEEFRSQHPQIPWSDIARMRDKMIHHYQEVNLREVWLAAQKDVPNLLSHLMPFVPKQD